MDNEASRKIVSVLQLEKEAKELQWTTQSIKTTLVKVIKEYGSLVEFTFDTSIPLPLSPPAPIINIEM
jgi:hypothetical protein